MATIGIPEALNAAKVVLDIAIKLANESKELARIEKGIRKTKKFLGAIDSRMKNKKHPLSKADSDLKSMLADDCRDIKSGCHEARVILNNRARMSVLDPARIIFILYSIPKLNDILTDFKESRDGIDKSITVIMTDIEKQAAAKLAQNKSKKEKQRLNEQIAQLKKGQEEDRKLREKARKERMEETDMLVNLLKELGKDKLQEVALGKGDRKKSVNGWVDELEKKGMAKKNARESIEKTLSAVKSEGKSQQKSLKKAVTKEIKKGERTEKAHQAEKEKQENVKRIEAGKNLGSVKKAQNGTKVEHAPKSEDGEKGASIGKPKVIKPPVAEQKHVWILCVDSTNGARSMMAQTYLELLRVWTMNTQKRWLFERVHSVGIRVPTDLNKSFLGAEKLKEAKAKEAVKDAPITAIAGEDSYFKTKDPDEKGTILKHMRGHKTSGPTDYHFENFEHIICFDEETKKVLEKMKKLAEASLQDKSPPENVTSHIHWLDCGSLKNDEDENMENLRKTAGKIKVAIKGFLKRNFQWEKPAIAIADGEWRTLQVLVPEETQKKLKNDGKWTITKEVSKKKGVQIRIGRDAGAQYLVSISGPKGKLEDAQKMLSI